jgi:DNA polymerase I
MSAAAESSATERRLFLIDGPSLVYRAFYALPESFATSAGAPTNAIYGFASMLVKIVTEHGVCPTVVAWDAGLSGREEMYPEYKAQRASRPDLLKAQWPAMEPLVEAFGYRNVRVEGYEADDVIATIAERALRAEPPVRTTIVTGDRDIFQLIDPGGVVEVMATAKGITETKLYDHAAVVERYGLPPESIPDYYGLKGDTSDNIPGVPGIGEKTASELIQRYGSVEEVLSNIEEIKGQKRKENLKEHEEDARVSKRLATVQRDVPLDVDPAQEAAREIDRSRVKAFFREYELRDPLRRLEEALGGAELESAVGEKGGGLKAKVRTGVPADIPAFAASVLSAAGPSVSPSSAAAATGEGELWVAVRRPETPEGALFAQEGKWRFAAAAGGEVLCGECEGPEEVAEACGERAVVVHDAKALGTIPEGLAHDTMIGAYLIEPARRRYGLAELCDARGLKADVKDETARDALLTGALAEAQRKEIEENGLGELMNEIELPLVKVLRAMEMAGVRLNAPKLQEVAGRVRGEIEGLEQEIFKAAGEEFLIASPQQLAAILFEKLKLSPKRRGKTGPSTDARVLQAIRDEHEIVPKIERWRELATLIKTYFDVLPGQTDEHSRIHTTFLQAVAQTGRISSTNPNMQNVPIRTELGREIRGCFEAEAGRVLIAADYSQIELRVLAHVADEPALKEVFARGEDVHTATAARVFGVEPEKIDRGMRAKAKMINYGIVYGLSDFGLADRLNIPIEEAKGFIDAYKDRFNRVARFMEETIERAVNEGEVRTLWGRRRAIPELRDGNHQVRAQGERLAVNTVVQGTGADIIKLAMVRCDRALKAANGETKGTRLILTIHDELLFEAPPEEIEAARALIEREMVGVWEHEPPMAVDIGVGANWLEAK